MNRFVTFCFGTLFLFASTSAFAQQSAIFFDKHALRGPEILPTRLPMELFEGMRPQNVDSTLGKRIQAAMQSTYAKVKAIDKHGVSISVIAPGAPQWSGSIGSSDSTHPMTTNLVFEIASCTKTFTAALTMKLQEEGKLSLKDSLHKWLPAYPNIDSTITIEQLLNHSSGIFDIENDDTTGALLNEAYFGDPSHVWTPEEILDNYVGEPNFKPGTSYRYSNTNFLLLGMIAERAGGADLGLQIHQNFIDPLHLTHTFFGGEDSIPLEFAHNWVFESAATGTDFYTIEKTGQLTCSRGYGNIVSTPSDIALWCQALYTGKFLSRASVKAMIALHNWPDGESYGLGTQFAPYYKDSTYGHTGHLPGFVSSMFTNPKDSVTVACCLNSDDQSDGEMNNYLLDMLNAVYSAPTKSVAVTSEAALPVSVYPNPSRTSTTVAYRLDRSSNVRLVLHDVLGREVATLTKAGESVGVHTASLDVSGLHNGTYFYSLQSESGNVSGKLTVEH